MSVGPGLCGSQQYAGLTPGRERRRVGSGSEGMVAARSQVTLGGPSVSQRAKLDLTALQRLPTFHCIEPTSVYVNQ